MAQATTGLPPPLQHNDTGVPVGIFIASFVLFLFIALVAQLLTQQWRSWLPGAESEKSMIGSVKAAVYTVMSHLT